VDFIEYWIKTKQLIDDVIQKYLSQIKDLDMLEVSKYILKDGKRYRAVLNMFFTEALGGELSNSLDAALAIEILHSSSLALDDIVDYDTTRRGKLSAWALYTNRRVVFITNYLIPSALNIISRYGENALKVSLELWKDTAVGAIKDMFGPATSYLSTIELKTSSLFKLSTALAAFTADREKDLDLLLDMGKYLGIMYQLIDDYIDCINFESGKTKELVGSAKQLYELYGKKYGEFVKSEYNNASAQYISLLSKLDVREKFNEIAISIPDTLSMGLLTEAGIKKL